MSGRSRPKFELLGRKSALGHLSDFQLGYGAAGLLLAYIACICILKPITYYRMFRDKRRERREYNRGKRERNRTAEQLARGLEEAFNLPAHHKR